MNFLEVHSTKDRSNTWRNIIAGVIVFGVVGVGVVGFFGSQEGSVLGEKIARGEFPFAEDTAFVQAGGDIVVDPTPLPKPPQLVGDMLDASELSAEAVLVKDVESGVLLYEKGAYESRSIASITKLMSALVVLEKYPDWATSTQVVSDDVVDTHMYAGDTYTLEELWRAALVGSSNKAILTLADAVGWPRDAFIERMNQKARELGMSHSHFTDPSGLDAGNMASPSDIALLLGEALEQPEIIGTLTLLEHQLYSAERNSHHHMWNTNWLLLGWIPHELSEIVAGKTGYIPASGYNFTMRTKDAHGHEIDVVVLGTAIHEDRFTVARDIAAWVFSNYSWHDDILLQESA